MHRPLSYLKEFRVEGLIILNYLFEQCKAVKVLEVISAGEPTERRFVLDMALALAEDRRQDLVKKTKNGLEAACSRWKAGDRLRDIDDEKRTVIMARREKGESIRVIAEAVSISVGSVSGALNDDAEKASRG